MATKEKELSNPNSCFNRARHDELMFVLLARDESASDTIRFWVSHRVSTGKNDINDPKIVEALNLADLIDEHNKQKD